MRNYDIRRGHFSQIEGDKLETMMKDIFGSVKKNPDGSYETSFGGLSALRIWVKDKKTLTIETVMDTGVDEVVAQETVRKYNALLGRVTGYTSKERSKRAQKKVKESKL